MASTASPLAAFRSILPHEPLPKEDEGYVLLQGTFQPRLVTASQDDKSSTTNSATINQFWSRKRLEETLLQALVGSKTSSSSSAGEPIIPGAVLDVKVLDEEAPFTKARLTLASPRDALKLSLYSRRHSFSCAQLFSSLSFPDQQADTWTFPTKALQVTRLTQQPRPNVCWTRSSPPKFRRLIPRPGEDLEALEMERAETRFVFVTNLSTNNNQNDDEGAHDENAWGEPWAAMEAIRSVMDAYDSSRNGVEVFCTPKKLMHYCHVGFRSAADAQRAMTCLQEKVVTWEWMDESDMHQQSTSGKLFLDYASVTTRSLKRAQLREAGQEVPRGEPSRSECTSTTDHVQVPGLLVIPDFVTDAEEEILLALLTGPQAPWAPSQRTPTEGGVVKRKVQHYGYVFDYKTADVLRDKTADPTADCPPMPQWIEEDESSFDEKLMEFVEEGRGWPVLAGVIERTRRTTYSIDGNDLTFPTLNQMTLNHYEPGEGIGSHVDTLTAFGDGLMSLSLQSGIVMEFRLASGEPPIRKLVYLPPRSLVVMSGPVRNEWEHMIVTRRTDTHNGEVLPRGTRVSLTFRTALDTDGKPMPRLDCNDYPLRWGQGSNMNSMQEKGNDSSLVTPECERRHVHDVYDAIARQWHHTRGRRGVLWPGATQFLQRLPPNSMVADVGCGDGKYFPAIWEAGSFVVGTDISRPLLQTAFPDPSDIPESKLPESRQISDDRRHLRERPAVAVGDCMNLPLRDHSFDAAICIAVLHHLSTHARRVQCLRELARVVRVGGLINVQAWALDQEEGSRRKFATEDVFVPFNAQPKYLDLQSTGVVSESSDDKGDHAVVTDSRSTAQVYSDAFNAQYDDRKGLVVFKRYCHLYRNGELEELVDHVHNLELVESGFEAGNYFLILQVKAETKNRGTTK